MLDLLRDSLTRLNVEGHVLVAVSGGADSVALLTGMCRLGADFSIEIGVAHFNHRLRGEESDADAAFVHELCRQLDVPCIVNERTVTTEAESGSREDSARRVRYEFLERTAVATDSNFIAVAHHADDQAETVLHHILRGTGIPGLGGIPERRELPSGVVLIRPLLRTPRGEIRDWLARAGQAHREDRSNADSTFTRNRIRNELLPRLEENFNPQVKTALCRLGAHAEAVTEIIDGLATELLDRAIQTCEAQFVECRLAVLREQPAYLVQHAFGCLWRERNWPRRRMGVEQWEGLAMLVTAQKGKMNLPGGVEARVEKGVLRLELTPRS